MRGWICLIFFARLTALVAACGSLPTNLPPENVTAGPAGEQQPYINFWIDKVTVKKSVGDWIGKGEFRLFIIIADTNGKTSRLTCPDNEPFKIDVGTIIKDPCTAGIFFKENETTADGVYIMVVGVDEDKSTGIAGMNNDIIASGLSDALSKAILAGEIFEGASGPVGITVSLIANFAVSGIKDWIEKAEVLGSAGMFLSKSDNWGAGRTYDVDTKGGGLEYVFTITRSETKKGLDIFKFPNVLPTQRPTPVHEVVPQEPGDFVRWYFNAIWQSREYENLWDYTTPAFRSSASPGGYQEYTEWWGSVKKATVHSVGVTMHRYDYCTVSVDVTFDLFDGRVLSHRKYDYDLTYSERKQSWVFDIP